MGYAHQLNMTAPLGSGEAAPAGGSAAIMQRALFENFDPETATPLIRSTGTSGWMEWSVSSLSRAAGIAMLIVAYAGTAYLATGLI